MYEDIIKLIKDKISFLNLDYARLKFTLLVSSILFVVSHIYLATNDFINEDDINLMGKTFSLGSGRWSRDMVGGIYHNYYLSTLMFLGALLLITFIVCIIVEIFDIKSKINIFLLAFFTATIPTNVYIFSYQHNIITYILAFFLATFSFYIIVKFKKNNMIIASFLLAFSVGIYQSYFSVVAALSVFWMIYLIIEKEYTVKELIKEGVRIIVYILLSIVIYLLMLKLMLSLNTEVLTAYKGAENIGKLPPLNMWGQLIVKTYSNFMSYFFTSKYIYHSTFTVIINAFLLITMVVNIFVFAKKKLAKDSEKNAKIIMLVILVMLIPFGVELMSFVAYTVDTNNLNTHSYVFVYAFCVYLFDKYNSMYSSNLRHKNIHIVSYLLVFIFAFSDVVYSNYLITNITYLKMDRHTKFTTEYLNRLVMRIQSVEGFDAKNNIVMFVGRPEDNGILNFTEVVEHQGYWGGDIVGMATDESYKFRGLTKSLLGEKFEISTREERNEFQATHSEEINEMGVYPQSNSIRLIDGVLVVKLNFTE